MQSNNSTSNSSSDALSEHRKAWKEIGLSVAKMDRDLAKAAIDECYRIGGLKPPKSYVWLGSPVAGALAAATLAPLAQSAYLQVVQNVKETVHAKFQGELGARGTSIGNFNEIRESLLTDRRDKTYANLAENIRTAATKWILTSTDFTLEGWFDKDPGDTIMQSLCHQLPVQFVERLGLTVQRGEKSLVQLSRCCTGSHEAHWLQLYDYARKDGFKLDDLSGLIESARHCGWWWPFEQFCIVTDRPKLLAIDSEGRFHRATGPSAEYRDGWRVFAWKGNLVEKRVVWFSQNMNVFDIDDEPNVEARRFMIEMYGIENFLRDVKAEKIDEDKYGKLYKRDLQDDEPIVMLEVLNSTPEPDGHYKTYFLRVAPHIRTSREAVAWTFGLRPEEYFPIRET